MKDVFQLKGRLVLVGLSVMAICACNLIDDIDFSRPSKNLKINKPVEVASEIVTSSGGTITVNSPGNKIDGLEISIPGGAYNDSRTFVISSSDITSNSLGEYFNPISPLIQIENGGGYAEGIMELTIPIEVVEGEIPIGFYYDEISGKLEAIPVKDYTENSITLLTRHFMSASDMEYNTDKARRVKKDNSSNIVISSLSESILKQTTIIPTDFNVGKDDWEFVNYGSYIAPGGHCAGQNIAAMWYYFEKAQKGEQTLNGRFSTHNNLWQDNAIGYRFCSVIHKDLDWNGKVTTFFEDYIDKEQSLDKLKFYTIAGAMLTTGEPQGIGIYRQKGVDTNGKPIYGGHDLICYKVGVNEGKLYISDPNKPGIEQSIVFNNDRFEPYIAKENGRATSFAYPFVTYYAKTAYIEWNKIGERYKELLDSTIGNTAPSNFPAYTVWVKQKEDVELINGFTPEKDTLEFFVECPSSTVNFLVDGKKRTAFMAYDETGNFIANSDGSAFMRLPLKPGVNKFGVYIIGWKQGYVTNNVFDPLFIDFKWYTVTNSKLKIEPNPAVGEPDEEIEFTAVYGGTPPANLKYEWDFGDETAKVVVMNSEKVKHSFTEEGQFDVVLKLYDQSSNTLIGEAGTTAYISKLDDTIAKLHKTKFVSSSTSFVFALNDNSNYNQAFNAFTASDTMLKWNNYEFEVYYNDKGEYDSNGFKTTYERRFKGTLSPDGKMITSLSYEYKAEYYRYHKWDESHSEKITFKNIPLLWAIGDSNWPVGYHDDFRYELEEDQLMPNLVSIEWRWWDAEGKNDIYGKDRLKHFSSPLYVRFTEDVHY